MSEVRVCCSRISTDLERPLSESGPRFTMQGVNHDTPDAIPERESETSESELPHGLKELLQLLKLNHSNIPEGKEAVTSVPRLHLEKYGDFFREEEGEGAIRSLRTRTEFERKIRLQVLEALGKCVTLQYFDNSSLHLTVPEWEALLIPLQSSTTLARVEWKPLENAETEAAIGRYWKSILMHSTSITFLYLEHGVREAFAAEVASGLKANPRVAMEKLLVGNLAHVHVANHVNLMIQSSPELNELSITDMWAWPKVEGALQGLCDAISRATSLREVWFDSYARGPSDEFVEDGYHHWITDLLPTFLRANVRQITVGDKYLHLLGPSEWRDLGNHFLQIRSKTEVDCSLVCFPYFLDSRGKLEDTLRGLDEFYRASGRSPLLSFSFVYSVYPRTYIRSFQICLTDPLSKSLWLCNPPLEDSVFQSTVGALRHTQVVTRLTLQSVRGGSAGGWKHFFNALRHNTSITHLEMEYCESLREEEFKDLMELLQVNFTLQEITLNHTPWNVDGKSAIIQETLDRNKRQENYFSVMRKAKFLFDGPKAGRIFLCGPPLAGKTQMKMAMMKSLGRDSGSESLSHSRLRNLLPSIGSMNLVLQRTRGIEIEMLIDNATHKISIWDLAGQHIFRTLHDLLFPRSNQPCIFAFVFSPWDRSNGESRLKADPLGDFSRELETWLRFLVSNIQVRGYTLPMVLVVITHKDKCEKDKHSVAMFHPEDILIRVNQLRQKFHGALDLCPDDRIDYINATSRRQMKKFKNYILLQRMDDLLRRKMHIVPRVCSELIDHLHSESTITTASPIWSVSRFHEYCCRVHDALKKFDPSDEWGKEVLRAITSYLHDVGIIIMIPRSYRHSPESESSNRLGQKDDIDSGGFVVVDPNWLTQNFLGELISLGHSFESKVPSYISQDGFININHLRRLVESIMTSERNKKRNVDFDTIVELMFDLDLCYEVKPEGGQAVRRFFMPNIGGQKEEDIVHGRRANYTLQWNLHPESNSSLQQSMKTKPSYFGFRLQCSDKDRTSLSWAFFPRSQIYLRKHFEKQKIKDDDFQFARNYVEIHTHGHDIFVEADDSFTADHVDVLVRSTCPKHLFHMAKQFVKEHIIDVLTSFCASPKGCPGVQLVLSIIRTECVKQLTPHIYRKESQFVSVSELAQNFLEDIQTNLAKGLIDSELFLSYKHSWPSVSTPGTIATTVLPREFEEARDLLGDAEVGVILKKIGVEQVHLGDELKEDVRRLEHICEKLDHCTFSSESKQEFSGSTQYGGSSFTEARKEEEKITFHEEKSSVSTDTKLILGRIDSMGKKIDGLRYDVQGLRYDVQALRNDVQALRRVSIEIRSRMDSLTSKLDHLIGYSKSKHRHKTPRRPYFSQQDPNLIEKATAKILFAEAVSLHLMCESRNGPHFVPGQEGVVIRLEEEGTTCDWMRKISKVSLKMIRIMLEAGLQLTAHVGSVIPDLYDIVAGCTVPVTNSHLRNHLSKQEKGEMQSQESLEESWLSLKDYLQSHLTAENCARNFKLHQVAYKDSSDPFAWLCESCVIDGRRKSLLDLE